MELEFAFFAEFAKIRDGFLDVYNAGLSGMMSLKFPTKTEQVFLVAKFRSTAEECGRNHNFRLEILRPNGERLHPDDSIQLMVNPNHRHPDRGASSTVIYQFTGGIIFPEPGEYTFNLYADEVKKGSVVFETRLRTN